MAIATAGLTGALVLGHAIVPNTAVALANSVIGAGGRDDVHAERVPAKLSGTVIPDGYGYRPVTYPATLDLAGSRDVGAAAMLAALRDLDDDGHLIVVGYSEGTLVAERVRRDLQTKAVHPAPGEDWVPDRTQLSFVMVGSPFTPNGGMYGRFPGFSVPFVIDAVGPSEPTRYDTVYHTLEYDPYGDFPAYFNPLALLNSALAVQYAHPDRTYDPLDPTTAPIASTTVTNGAGGTDTYVLYRNLHLPLLAPLRDLAARMGLTRFTEPVLGAVEPLLRLAVDMAYTDRTYADAARHVPFSFVTPTSRIVETLMAVPGAVSQGIANATSGARPTPQSRVAPAPETDAPEADTDPTMPASQRATPAGDDTPRVAILRPTVISDGNKVTPAGAPESPATTTGSDQPTTGADAITDTASAETAPPAADPAPSADPPEDTDTDTDTDAAAA